MGDFIEEALQKTYDDIVKEYNLIKVSDSCWRTQDGRVYIKREDTFNYKVYSCKGDYITSATNLRLAAIRATTLV